MKLQIKKINFILKQLLFNEISKQISFMKFQFNFLYEIFSVDLIKLLCM